MSRQRCGWRVLLRSVALALPFCAGQAQAADPVDVTLVLAVDVSLSMSPMELEIQREGYAAALRDEYVIEAIQSGYHGRIAVTYFEWAGNTMQRVVVPWTVIADADDAQRFAAQLSAAPPNSARRTSISGALEFGADLLAESPFNGVKRVIDISGDGPNNQGAPVQEARDQIAAQGIVINGLPLMTRGGGPSMYDVTELDRYYADCVIAGPGAFMVPVNDWSQFPEAIRRKLVMELAGRDVEEGAGALPVVKTTATPTYDCLIGEKMWRDRSWMFDQR
ncbi:MAG: DUF1194 domain-containing protein [Rhizobiaceae bacterium]